MTRSQQSQRRPYPHGEIVDEIMDNDLEENIWNKFINIYKGPVDLKEVTIMEVVKNKIVKMLLFVSTVFKNLGKKSQKILCRHLQSPWWNSHFFL